MRFAYEPIPEWPPLAWLAACRRGSVGPRILHGRDVETTDDWFGEVAWAGDYAAGDFDRTDLVAGSGARYRDGRVFFVSAGSTVDRLHALSVGETTWVSNSLPCVLTAAGAKLDPSYPRYYRDLASVVRGIARYVRTLQTSMGPLELVYFDNLAWDGVAISRVAKPLISRDFSMFAKYRAFLEDGLAQLAENLAAHSRARRYRMLGTLSSGYDSTTVSTLARQAGCQEVLCFDRAWPEQDREQALRRRSSEGDSGAETARLLGMRPILVPLDGWRSLEMPEIPFLAVNGMGEEVRFKSAERHLAGCLLFTGYHGDKMWAKQAYDLSSDIVRGDPSGSGLGEYRLWIGFLHCPVAFWGVRQIAQVHAITHSTEMALWDVPGDYSRPICRRIVETAGVPRERFGVRKLAASVMLHDDPQLLTPDALADYFRWIGENRDSWLRRGALPPMRVPQVDRFVMHATESVVAWMKRTPGMWRLPAVLRLGYGPTRLRSALFPWAVDRAMRRYALQEFPK